MMGGHGDVKKMGYTSATSHKSWCGISCGPRPQPASSGLAAGLLQVDLGVHMAPSRVLSHKKDRRWQLGVLCVFNDSCGAVLWLCCPLKLGAASAV